MFNLLGGVLFECWIKMASKSWLCSRIQPEAKMALQGPKG